MEDIRTYWEQMQIMRTFVFEMEKTMQPFCSHKDLTMLQVKVLVVLQEYGAQTVSNIAKLTNTAGANTSVLCKKMEKDGLVLRERDPEDERQVIVALTPLGDSIVKEFTVDCQRQVEQIHMQMTIEEAQTINKGIQAILDILARMQNNEEVQNEERSPK